MQTNHSSHPQDSTHSHPQIPPEPQPQSPSAESTESNLRSSLNLNPRQSGMESSNKRISQLTSISTTSSLEPYNDVTLSTLESKSYLGDDSLPPNTDTIPTTNQTQIESNLTGSSSNSDPVKVVGGHLPGRLQVGNGNQDQRGAEAVGRSSHDGVVSTKEPNDLISRFVRKATSSNSLKGKGSNVERQTHPSISSSSSSPKDPPSKLQQPSFPYPSSSSNPSDNHHQSRNLTNGEDPNQSSNLRSRQIGTSDTDFSVLSSKMGSTSQSIYSQGLEEGLRSRGMDRPNDDRFQGNHHRDATITRKSVEKSRSLEKRRLQEQQQLQQQSSSSQMMTVPSSNPGGSSSSLGATSIASSGGGHVFGGLGIDEEIKRHLSIESSTSSNPSASSNKEKTPSRTASIFRPLGKAFRKKTKGKEKERDKGKESMTTDGEDETMITGGWKEDDGENLLISRPHPGFLNDGVISPTSLDGRRLAQNELDAFNLSGDQIPPTSTSQQQQQQQQQHHPSRTSVERSSGSASGSAASNFGGDISGSGTGTAATSVSGDQMPRKSLNLNNSRTSSDLDNSYSRFGSDGRNSQDLSRNVNLGRQGGAYFTSSEDDADEEEASERDQRSNANANGRKKKVESQDREEILNSSSSDYRSRKFSSSRPSPPKAGDQGSLSNQHSDLNPKSDSISPEWSKQSLPSSQNSTSSVLQSQSSKVQLAPHSPLNTRASLGTSRPSEKAILGAGPGSRSVSGPSSVSSGGSGEKNGNNSGGGRMAAFSKFLSPKDEDENEFPASTIPTSSAIMGMGSFMNPVYPTTSRDLKESDSKSSGFRSISRKSLKKAQLQTIADAANAANQLERELLSSSNEMSPTTIKSLADEQEENAAALQKPRRSIFNLGLSRKPSVSIGNGSKFTAPQPLVLDPNREAQSPLQRDFSPSPSPMSTSPRASIDQSSPITGARRARRRPRTSGGEISTNSGDSWNSFGITKTGGNGASRSRKVSVTSGGVGSDKELLDSPTKPFASASSPRGSDFGNDRQRNPRSRRDSVVSLDRPRTSTGFKDSETFPSSSSSSITTSKIDSGGGAAALFGSPRQRASSLLPVFNFGRNRSPSNGNLPSPSGISPTTVAPSDSPIQSHNNPLSAIAASIAANDVEAMESMRRSSTTVDSGHQRGGVGPNGSNPLFLQTQTGGLLSASPASSVPPSPSPSTSVAGGSGDPSPSNTSESPATTSFFPSNAVDPFQSNLKKKTDSSILAPGPKESAGAYAKRVAKSIPRADVAATLSLSSDDFASSALRSHMRKYLFAGNPLDIALRKLLMDMRLPKETQQIDRVMEAFAKRYMECNDGLFASEDQPYILAFSLMMLHTDAFNKNAKNKMSKSDYLKNTSSSGVAPEILEYLYDNLILAEFIYVDDSSDLQRRLTDSESPLTPNVFNAISGGVPGSSTKSRIDPYHIIVSGRTSQFRPEIESIIPEDSPYQPTGSIDYDVEDLRKCFLAAPWIEIATSRPSIPTGSAWAGTDYPTTAMISSFMANEPPEQFVTLKITKADLVSRKDDVVEGSKKARSRKWAQCGMLLTSAQLLFFKDTTWVHALSMQIAKQHREAEMVGQNISRGFPIQPRVTAFKPDLVISLSDAVAVRDATYSKYDHVFRLVVNQNSELHGRQYLIQADSQADVDDWIAKINYRAAFRSMGIEIRGLSTDKAKAGGGSSDNGSLSSPPLGPTPSSPESAKFDSYRPSLSSSASSVRSGVWQRRLNSRKALLEPKLNQARENLVKISREVEDEMRLARHLSILTPFQKSTRDRIEAAAVPLARRLKIRRLMFAQASSIVDVLAADLAHTEEELQTSSGMSTMEITSQQMELALKAPASQLGTPQLIEMGGSAEQQDFDALFGAAAAAAATASNANSSGLDTPISTGSGTPSISRRGSARRSERSQYPPPSRSTRASSSRPPAPAPPPTSSLPSLPSLSLSESGLKIESSLLSRSTEAGQQTPKRSSSEAAGEVGNDFNMPSSRPEESSFLSMPSGYDSSASDSPVFSRFTRDLPALPNEQIDRKGKSREAEAARSSSEAEQNFGHADTYRSDSDVEPVPNAWFKSRAGDPERGLANLNSEQLQRISPQEQAQET